MLFYLDRSKTILVNLDYVDTVFLSFRQKQENDPQIDDKYLTGPIVSLRQTGRQDVLTSDVFLDVSMCKSAIDRLLELKNSGLCDADVITSHLDISFDDSSQQAQA